MPNPQILRGYAALFNAGRAKIADNLRTAGAAPALLQRFNNRLATGQPEIARRFRQEITTDPEYLETLDQYTVGSDEWNATVTRIAETVRVVVLFIADPTHLTDGRIVVSIGAQGQFPIFDIG